MAHSETEMCHNVFSQIPASAMQHAAGSWNVTVVACSGRGKGQFKALGDLLGSLNSALHIRIL